MNNLTFNQKIINNYLKSHHLTIKQFSEKCNIRYYNYRQIMKNDLNVYSNVLYRICKIINIKLSDLIAIKKRV